MTPQLSLDEVLELIKDRLGIEVPRKAIYNELQRGKGRPGRVTADLPAPVDGAAGSRAPLAFEESKIEAWLRHHPQLLLAQAADDLHESVVSMPAALTPGEEERAWFAAVDKARESGLSFARIAELISSTSGAPISRQSVHERWTRLSKARAE